ncbi:5-methyltetrahydropteroyltriglutamate--homocysteine methyltransferase [Tanacetum coccineum]
MFWFRVTSSQDDETRLRLVDDLKVFVFKSHDPVRTGGIYPGISTRDYMHFYRLSHSELVDIEKVAVRSSLRSLKSKSFRHYDTERLSRSDEVLKLKNFKKNATLKLFKSTNQERYEHVGLEVTSSQDDETRLRLVDDLKVVALRGSDHPRATSVGARLDAQQKKLKLSVLPITTIGSFPQTIELRRVRPIKEEIYKVVKLQEELDIDVLVHGEPELNHLVPFSLQEYMWETNEVLSYIEYMKTKGWLRYTSLSQGSRARRV